MTCVCGHEREAHEEEERGRGRCHAQSGRFGTSSAAGPECGCERFVDRSLVVDFSEAGWEDPS